MGSGPACASWTAVPEPPACQRTGYPSREARRPTWKDSSRRPWSGGRRSGRPAISSRPTAANRPRFSTWWTGTARWDDPSAPGGRRCGPRWRTRWSVRWRSASRTCWCGGSTCSTRRATRPSRRRARSRIGWRRHWAGTRRAVRRRWRRTWSWRSDPAPSRRKRRRPGNPCSSAPSPEAPDVVVQHEELLEHRHAFAFPAELGEQLPQPTTSRHVEPERLGEILLRMRRGVRGDVVRERGSDAPALEVDPLRVGDAVRLAHLPERPPEPPGSGERPIVIEEGVPQFVQDQPGQHVPRDLVAPPSLAGHVPALDLDNLGGPVRHAGNARPQQHAVVPILQTADDQELPRTAQRLADQVAPGGIFAAPRADVHPVVYALVAVRADVLELLVAPLLRAPAPGTRAHWVHHAAAAPPLAAPVVPEPFRGLERLGARVPVGDVATAPGTKREAVRHHPAAVVALRAGLLGGVAPLEPAAAVRAVRPEALHFRRA